MGTRKINIVERIHYAGGLYGLFVGSSRGRLQAKIDEMNNRGYNLHVIHADNPNILLYLVRLIILVFTLGIWTLGSSELLIFEKETD
jgi:hypothetical protein